MLAVISPGSDFKRYYRGRMPRLALVVIILMPLLYGALYLWAFWNPFDAVNKLPVAIVNLDKGAEVEGEKLAAGDETVTALIESKQLDLHVTSEREAEEGLAHGDYYFTITLPEDFSEAIASPATASPKQAQLIFTYNEANNYLATVIGEDAAQQVASRVNAQVGAQFVEVVVKALGDARPMINEAVEGIDELDSGSAELASGLAEAASGGDQLASAIDELTGAVDGAVTPLLNQLQGRDNTGITAAEMDQTLNRLAGNAEAVNNRLESASVTQTRASQGLDTVIAGLSTSGDPAARAAAEALAPIRDSLVSEGLGPEATGQLSAVRDDSAALATALADPNSPLRMVASLLEDGQLVRDLQTVQAGAGELRSGADQLSAGLNELAPGADELHAGIQELDQKVTQAVGEIPAFTGEQAEQLATVIGEPVELREVVNNEAKTFGTGFAPFFFSLALFVGGIIVWMLLTPLQSRPIAHGFSSMRTVLSSYFPAWGIGILQAAILYSVVVLAIGLDPKYPFATFAFMVLIVASFLATIQMFNALFGPAVGRVITLAWLMIQLCSAGGIYPVPTTAKPFQYIHYVDPMTYTVNGLRQLTVGGIDSRLWVSIAVLAGITIGCLLVSTWAARRNRQYTMDRLYPPVEV